MSESQKPTTITVNTPDAGVGFRAEMAVNDFIIGYWKHGVAVVVVGLLGVLLYGQWSNWKLGEQRTASSLVATEQLRLLEAAVAALPDEELRTQAKDIGFRPGIISDLGAQLAPLDDATKTKFNASADALVKIAGESDGSASVEAWLSAAELYRMTGASDQRRQALEKASYQSSSGVLWYVAETALAHQDLDAGKVDEAATRLQAIVAGKDAFFAQQASNDLGSLYESQQKNAEALAVYSDYLQKWPEGSGAAQVKERVTALGGTPPEVKTESAPTEPAPEGAPKEGAPAEGGQ